MELTIKGLKTMDGPDGLIFQCSVLVDGKRRFTARNDGNGGCNMYDPIQPYAESRQWIRDAEAWTKTLPPRTSDLGGRPFTYDTDLDCVIEDLIVEELDRRWLKTQCRNKTLFRTDDTPDDQWMTINHKFDPGIRAYILNKYPDATIANESV